MEAGTARDREADDYQARARNAVDRVAGGDAQPRHADPEPAIAIAKAWPTDLAVIAVGNVEAGRQPRRPRPRAEALYLNTSTNVLWTQTQTWTTATPPALPSTASSPDAAWPAKSPVVEGVTAASVSASTRRCPRPDPRGHHRRRHGALDRSAC